MPMFSCLRSINSNKQSIIWLNNTPVTLNSSPEHQKADWLGIHEKICQLLIPLRTPMPMLGSEEDRQHRKNQQLIRQVDYYLIHPTFDCPCAWPSLMSQVQKKIN